MTKLWAWQNWWFRLDGYVHVVSICARWWHENICPSLPVLLPFCLLPNHSLLLSEHKMSKCSHLLNTSKHAPVSIHEGASNVGCFHSGCQAGTTSLYFGIWWAWSRNGLAGCIVIVVLPRMELIETCLTGVGYYNWALCQYNSALKLYCWSMENLYTICMVKDKKGWITYRINYGKEDLMLDPVV